MPRVISQMLRSVECRSNWAQKCAQLLLHRTLRTTESPRGSGPSEYEVSHTLPQPYMQSWLADSGNVTLYSWNWRASIRQLGLFNLNAVLFESWETTPHSLTHYPCTTTTQNHRLRKRKCPFPIYLNGYLDSIKETSASVSLTKLFL